MSAQTTAPASTPVHHQNLLRVLRSEWIKFRTLRSSWTSLAAVLIVMIGISAIAASVSVGRSHGDVHRAPLEIVLTGTHLGLLLLGVIGCLAGSREYGSRMITATLAAVPRRWPVMLAKTVVLIGIAVPIAVGGTFAAFFLGMSILKSGGLRTIALSDPGITRVVIGTALYLVGISLLGLSLGVLLRSTAASIGTLIGGVLILPEIASALLPDSWQTILKYLPTNAAASFTEQYQPTDGLTATWGAIVFGAWVLVAVGGATYVITRRDV
jgi:ABC-2 type transport system permease protein